MHTARLDFGQDDALGSGMNQNALLLNVIKSMFYDSLSSASVGYKF
jgi:hypothetical protein